MRLLRLFLMTGGLALASAAPAQAPKAKAPAVKPAAARDWRTSVVKLPNGAFAIGNPAAKVKLVEYLSYTCPHCAHFVAESKAPLHDALVRRGLVRVEFRHAVRDPLDMGAALLARCAGARGFSSASEALFASQANWFQQGAQWFRANGAALEGQPEIVQIKRGAEGAGLIKIMRDRGMTAAAADQCFATPSDLNTLTTMTQKSWTEIKGTPSFTVNGKPADASDWAALAPQLRAAGAR